MIRTHRTIPLAAAFAALLIAGIPLAGQDEGASPPPLNWTTAEDHRDMQTQLGITALRPGPSGREGAPNPANYDESVANPFPEWPDLLTLDDGTPVTSAESWWNRRRPEIVEAFEREVVGRIPAGVPMVEWSVTRTQSGTIAGQPVMARQLIGRVDNSAYPPIEVHIEATLVVPADSGPPAPVMIMFRGGDLDQALGVGGPGPRGGGARGADPPATEQLIAAGWGFAFLNPRSIQADNGAGLTRGIIGLVNKGAGAQARRLGLVARLVLGRWAASGLSGNGPGGGCLSSRNRRGLPLRQGGNGDHGFRAAIRRRSDRFFR